MLAPYLGRRIEVSTTTRWPFVSPISPGNISGANRSINTPISGTASGLHSRAGCVPVYILRAYENEPCAPRVGAFTPFVDPMLAAPEAPLAWSDAAAAPTLQAMTARPDIGAPAHLPVAEMQAARNVIVGPGDEELVILSDSNHALTLQCQGSRGSLGPIDIRLLLHGVPEAAAVARSIAKLEALTRSPAQAIHRSLWRILRRDAIAALDGRCLGATYRDVAAVLYGQGATRKGVWQSANNPLKEHMRRALAMGRYLRDGGYRDLLD